jgi:hypothetical protein
VMLVLATHKRTNVPLVTTVNVVHLRELSAQWELTMSMLVVRLSRTAPCVPQVTIVTQRVPHLALVSAQTVTSVSPVAESQINSLVAPVTTPTKTPHSQRTVSNLKLFALWVPTTTSTVSMSARLALKATTVTKKA